MHQIERPISVKMLHEGDTFNIYVAQQALSTMTKHFPYRHEPARKLQTSVRLLNATKKKKRNVLLDRFGEIAQRPNNSGVASMLFPLPDVAHRV
ncbi:MAG TPA: hypothetical protein VKM94_08315 [Blastocatellia bacterium]|nr:hypothetical protein [Blastocatellia bacterium]